jgi:succinate-semialdehyde dehydrogenase/glutarate-semialdehyde dehydrogenase
LSAATAVADPGLRELAERVLAWVPKELLIGGRWQPGSNGRTFGVEDPASGEELCRVAEAEAEDCRAALGAAVAAQAELAASPPRVRAELLRRTYERMVERKRELALLMTLEMGKTVSESEAEIDYAAEFFRWFSEEAVRIHGNYLRNPAGPGRILTLRQPVGPCLLITPWNFPAAMAARKVAPALAAGCAAVIKPAEQTPLSTLALVRIMEEEGLPAGAVNVVLTTDPAATVEPLLEAPELRKLSFTGSTAVGKRLMARAASNLLRLSLELGGNAPFLVFADADLEEAVEGAITAKLRNIGEACTAANRFLVEAPIARRFAELLAKRLAQLRLGHGTDPATAIGPLIDGAQLEKVKRLVEDACRRGAELLCGGKPVAGRGYFFEPTVVFAPPTEAPIAREEIFGPVAAVYPFADEREGVALANGTEYGLVAYLYTRDLSRALRVAEELEVGMVGLNQGIVSNPAAPFGGIKHSGFGREGGFEGIEEYLALKYVAISDPAGGRKSN